MLVHPEGPNAVSNRERPNKLDGKKRRGASPLRARVWPQGPSPFIKILRWAKGRTKGLTQTLRQTLTARQSRAAHPAAKRIEAFEITFREKPVEL